MRQNKLTLGAVVHAMRVAQSLTQLQLAVRSELDQSFINRLEQDKTSIRVENLARIARTLGTSTSQIMRYVEVGFPD